jgi:DNA-binding Lrp family transcriptional regulator
MEEFRKKMSDKLEKDYPEMKRDITAYVLMNIQGDSELKVVEKLFTLREVQEVHTVHGAFDVIAKIVLTRDLLSSDSEIIGQFVHDIRQVPGVNSTQTLIPAFSKVKQQAAE